MSVEWNDIFRLPPAALVGRRVPKAALLRNARLTRLEQRALDKVSLIEHWATVQKSSTRIPPHVDEERDIQAVVFLRCELTGRSAACVNSAFSNNTNSSNCRCARLRNAGKCRRSPFTVSKFVNSTNSPLVGTCLAASVNSRSKSVSRKSVSNR